MTLPMFTVIHCDYCACENCAGEAVTPFEDRFLYEGASLKDAMKALSEGRRQFDEEDGPMEPSDGKIQEGTWFSWPGMVWDVEGLCGGESRAASEVSFHMKNVTQSTRNRLYRLLKNS